MKNRRWKDLGAKLFLAPFFLLSVALAGLAIHNGVQNLQTKNWLSTKGRIVKNEIQSGRVQRGGGGSNTKNIIIYEYDVEGRTFRSDQIALNFGGGPDHEPRRAIYQKLKNATSVIVYYNPKNHNEAILLKKIFTTNLIWDIGFFLAWTSIVSPFFLMMYFPKWIVRVGRGRMWISILIGLFVSFMLITFSNGGEAASIQILQ